MPVWAYQLLPQLLMQHFDTFPSQCGHIEHMHEGVWFKNIFCQNERYENDWCGLLEIYPCINLSFLEINTTLEAQQYFIA